MIRINTGADLEDMFGGQVDFEVSVTLCDDGGLWDIIGAGHTVAEAVADARATLRTWRKHAEDLRDAVVCNDGFRRVTFCAMAVLQ